MPNGQASPAHTRTWRTRMSKPKHPDMSAAMDPQGPVQALVVRQYPEWKCEQCGEIYPDNEVLKGANPFDEADIITGCPNCKSIDSFVRVCDEPECQFEATCGWPSADGYRQTCSRHRIADIR